MIQCLSQQGDGFATLSAEGGVAGQIVFRARRGGTRRPKSAALNFERFMKDLIGFCVFSFDAECICQFAHSEERPGMLRTKDFLLTCESLPAQSLRFRIAVFRLQNRREIVHGS